MKTPLRVLFIDDSPNSPEIFVSELSRGGYDVSERRVYNREGLRSALSEQPWDVILCEYAMAGFDAMAAIVILKDSGYDVPFIIVSGTVGEEAAVDALKAGAHDFLMKGSLARLLPAIERELREAEVRRERREAIEELKLAVQARDDFLSIASHELRTPLTTLDLQLASAIKVLSADGGADLPIDRLKTKLETAARQVTRLAVLIDNLTDVTRITSGHYVLLESSVDLGEVVKNVAHRTREAVAHSRSKLSIEYDGPVVGFWDPIGLEAIAYNLLSNAIKFGAGKPIEIRVQREGDAAALTIRDHGIGIPPEAQSRIFQRFERAVPVEHYGGFGIGLWVARQIAEAHGGGIRVSSTEGAGSTFVVTLPIKKEAKSS